MSEPAPDIVARIVERLAVARYRRYEAEYHAGHLTWRDFADVAAHDVALAFDMLADHISVAGRAALTANDNQLWEIRNANTDSWLDQLAEAARHGAWKR